MDAIVVLDSGRLVDSGSFEDIRLRSASLIEQAEASIEIDDMSPETNNAVEEQFHSKTLSAGSNTEDLTSQEMDQGRQSGSWSVYAYYSRSAGTVSIFLWVFGTILGAVFTNIARKLFLHSCSGLKEFVTNPLVQQFGLRNGQGPMRRSRTKNWAFISACMRYSLCFRLLELQ